MGRAERETASVEWWQRRREQRNVGCSGAGRRSGGNELPLLAFSLPGWRSHARNGEEGLRRSRREAVRLWGMRERGG